METSTRSSKSASLISIGERLKKARESKSLTIDQVQKKTRIHATVLLALEDGNCETLMSGTYARSFLKTYASYLGLDTDGIMKEYSAIRPPEQRKFEPAMAAPHAAPSPLRGSDTILKILYGVSAVVLLVVVLFFANAAWKKISASFKKARRPRTVVAATAAKTKTTSTRNGGFTSIYIPKKDPIKLSIRIKQPVRIQLKKDGVLLFDRVMPKDMLETFTADSRINIFVAKAESIEITVNGRSFGSPGRGVLKDLEITRSGIRVR